jgi:hypothetical protein
MFQLRFLLATPRKAAPHIFTHRDYRGQRTSPDDFHSAWNTYVCEPKGTPGENGYKSSQDVMLDLAQHSAQNNPSSHLFTIVEIWNPENRNRIKLAGDEIILRPSDLAAAQEAFNATQPATQPPPVNGVNPVNEVPAPGIPVTESGEVIETPKLFNEAIAAQIPPIVTVLARVRTEIQTNGKATATQLANTLGISATAIKDAVQLPDSGLQNKGGWISLIPTEN